MAILFVLHIVLFLVAFLIMLNGFLRGQKRLQLDAALAAIWLAVLVSVFLLSGWKAGLLAFVLSFVYTAISKPIARRLARRMLGYRTSPDESWGGNHDFSVEGLFQRADATERRLERIARTPKIARLLKQEGMSGEDLTEQFWYLMGAGLGELSWEIVSSPNDLRLLLALRKQGEHHLSIASKLMRS